MPNLDSATLVLGFIWYVAFLFSTTCHEASGVNSASSSGHARRDTALL
jgi:hypothetical protein